MDSRRRRLAIGTVVLLVAMGLALAWLTARDPSASRSTSPGVLVASPDGATRSVSQRGVAIVTARASEGMPSKPVVASVATWGGGEGQLGRSAPQEGNPEAPMSFAIGAGGQTVVIDQVNGRLARFGADGRPLAPVPVTQQAPQDVAVARDGTTVVLDRVKDKTVAILQDGRLVSDLPVEGKGIPEGGGVTGVFVDGKDVYLEREHGSLVRVGDTDGKVDDERPEIPGRPSRDGKSYLLAGLVDAQAGRAFVSAIDRASMDPRFTRELRLGQPLLALVLLDSDLSGTIYLGALLEPTRAAGSIRVVCLSSVDGAPTGTADIPANSGADETFRELAVLDGGGVLYAQRSASGVSYVRYDCR